MAKEMDVPFLGRVPLDPRIGNKLLWVLPCRRLAPLPPLCPCTCAYSVRVWKLPSDAEHTGVSHALLGTLCR